MKDFLPSRNVSISLITMATIGVISLLFHSQQSTLTAASIVPPRVETVIAQADRTPIPLDVAGFVGSDRQADIAPAASGRVTHIHRREGEFVKQGDLLATLSDITVESQVSIAKNQVAALKRTLDESERYNQQLVDQAKEDDSATRESIQSAKRARDLNIRLAKNQLILAQGALDIARARAGQLSVIAPFAGTVETVFAREGEFVAYGKTIFSIASPGGLEIETSVPATDGRILIPGLPVTLTTAGGRSITGALSAVTLGSDLRSQKTFVRIRLTDGSDTVRLGNFLHGTILIPRTDPIITLSRRAVVSRGGDSVVFTVDDDSVTHEHAVDLGAEYDGKVEILSGIDADERVIVSGQSTLTDSMTVTPYETK